VVEQLIAESTGSRRGLDPIYNETAAWTRSVQWERDRVFVQIDIGNSGCKREQSIAALMRSRSHRSNVETTNISFGQAFFLFENGDRYGGRKWASNCLRSAGSRSGPRWKGAR